MVTKIDASDLDSVIVVLNNYVYGLTEYMHVCGSRSWASHGFQLMLSFVSFGGWAKAS